MHWDALGCIVMQWKGMGGPKSLGLGGRCQDVMDCDESPWEGMGGPKSLGLGGRCQYVMDCDESPWEGMGRPMASLESSDLQRKFKNFMFFF